MNLIRGAIERPVAVIAAVLMAVLFGGVALTTIPIQLTPDVQRPIITIETDWPGASPVEVEREIAKHPDVFECAVVAAPDPEYGEAPWAFIQPHAGRSLDSEVLADALRASGLATYKIPTRFIELPEFPRVASDKIDKKALLQMAPAE